MKHYVYILESVEVGRWYIGASDDPQRRLREHNAGKHRSTKGYAPYRLIHTEEFSTKKEALQREKFIKISGRIRKELKDKHSAPSSIG
ncbi:MAG TPA: GIY-YIG nuclease family protein [Patescibacteria group bacterium]|nr:GIY-YIG nuclease family protein [Patescibacteria group bacterium]